MGLVSPRSLSPIRPRVHPGHLPVRLRKGDAGNEAAARQGRLRDGPANVGHDQVQCGHCQVPIANRVFRDPAAWRCMVPGLVAGRPVEKCNATFPTKSIL